MSYYYKYNFISPEELYATVKEEFSSYFDTGVVDDLMFPIWTKDCLDKLGRGSYQIKETYIELKDYQARLPSDFKAVREVWGCVTTYQSAPIPGALYTQTTMRITPYTHECTDECDQCSHVLPI